MPNWTVGAKVNRTYSATYSYIPTSYLWWSFMVQSLSLPCRIKRINKMTNKEKDKSKFRQFLYSILPFSCSKLIFKKTKPNQRNKISTFKILNLRKQKQISTKPNQKDASKWDPIFPHYSIFRVKNSPPKKRKPPLGTVACHQDVLLHFTPPKKKDFTKKKVK